MNPRTLRLLPTALLLLTVSLAAQEKGDGDKGAKGTKPEAAKPAGDKVDFATQVLPILEKNCVECHKAAYTDSSGKQRRPKGGVMFDSKAGITASKKGKLVVAKKPDESKLIAAISLPADDEDRMPPAKKGDPLPKEQIDLLKKWIEQGADFGTWTGAAEKGKDGKETKDGKDGKKPEDKGGKDKGEKGKDGGKGKDGAKEGGHGKEHGDVRALGQNLAPLADDVFEQLAALHAHTDEVAEECPLVRVSFLGNEDTVDDAAVAKLQCAQDHIAELVLARTPIDDAACASIAMLPNLVHLDLRETRIGDAGVAHLAALPHLRSLNLFGTQVGDVGLAALSQCAELEQLYVWQTPVSANAVVALQHARPSTRIVFAADLPEPLADESANGRGRRNR